MKKMLKKGKAAVLFLVLVLAAGCLSGCGGSGSGESELSEIRVAYFPNITHSQALVMKNKKMLEESLGEGVNVKWLEFNAGTEEVEAFFAGEVDIGLIGPIPAISGHCKSNGDMVIISGACDGGAVLVTRSDVHLNSVKDLDGLTISVPSLGNTQHLNLLNLLSENGLETTDNGGTVKVQPVKNSDVKTLMDSKELDAAIVPEPWGSILENEVGANVLLDWRDVWRDGDYSTSVVVTTKDFLSAHPDAVEKFMNAHIEATDYMNNNQEESKSIVNAEIEAATQKGFDQSILDSSFSRLTFTADISKESIQEFAQIYKDQGFIDSLPGEELFDSSILDKVKQ